jgi:hypothetical protein
MDKLSLTIFKGNEVKISIYNFVELKCSIDDAVLIRNQLTKLIINAKAMQRLIEKKEVIT